MSPAPCRRSARARRRRGVARRAPATSTPSCWPRERRRRGPGPADRGRVRAPRAGRGARRRVLRRPRRQGADAARAAPGRGRGPRDRRDACARRGSCTSPTARRCTCARCSRARRSSTRSSPPTTAARCWRRRARAPTLLCDPMVDPRGGAYTVGLGVVENLAVFPYHGTAADHLRERSIDLLPTGAVLAGVDEETALIKRADGAWTVAGRGRGHPLRQSEQRPPPRRHRRGIAVVGLARVRVSSRMCCARYCDVARAGRRGRAGSRASRRAPPRPRGCARAAPGCRCRRARGSGRCRG